MIQNTDFFFVGTKRAYFNGTVFKHLSFAGNSVVAVPGTDNNYLERISLVCCR